MCEHGADVEEAALVTSYCAATMRVFVDCDWGREEGERD
jgi:hypothetical protein